MARRPARSSCSPAEPDELALVRRIATEIEVGPASRRGPLAASRDMYVVLSRQRCGGGRRRNLLGRLLLGKFSASWPRSFRGASFGRAHSADVIADEPTRLLKMDWHLTDQLMKDAPGFAEVVERVAHDPLGTL